MQIQDLMSPEVQFCRINDTLETAARIMWEFDCGCVPICSGDGDRRVVGIITDRDICMSTLFTAKRLSEVRVGEVMSRDLSTCLPDDSSSDVGRIMGERQVRRIPVTDQVGALVGIVSLADLVGEAGLRGSPPREDISEGQIAATLAGICYPQNRRRERSVRASVPSHRYVYT